MELINKIKHFIDYGRKGSNPMQPVGIIYGRFYDLPIKAVWSMEVPRDIDEKEYFNEERIKHELARKLAEEIKKYMRYEERPPLPTGSKTKRVAYEAEIKILVNADVRNGTGQCDTNPITKLSSGTSGIWEVKNNANRSF